MTSTYIDCIHYTKQPTGVSLANYIGNMGRLTSASLASATSLTVQPLSVPQVQYDDLYIFDGPNSEVVQVGSAGASVGATSIPLQAATQYAHAAGTPYCTDGAGSLGAQLFTASRDIEDICHQSLWSTTYTGEILTMPTMRAAIDNQCNLHFRPRHFPITALTSLSIQQNQQYVVNLDQTQAIIDADQMTVDIPNIATVATSQSLGQANPYLWQALNRTANAWITLTYTAGFALGQLPWAVTRAATLLTSECFVQLSNPLGADQITQGKRQVMFTMRGDTSGESLLRKQAESFLSPYIAQSF